MLCFFRRYECCVKQIESHVPPHPLSTPQIQTTPDLDRLLEEAQVAQRIIKAKIMHSAIRPDLPDGLHAKDPRAAHSQQAKRDLDDAWPTKSMLRNSKEADKKGESDRLVSWVHEAFDPGIKTLKRCIEKANYKYSAAFGTQRFRRVRDISRL